MISAHPLGLDLQIQEGGRGLCGGRRGGLATTHLPLREVADAITPELLDEVIRILHADLKSKFGITRPRILVAGLNPHAGESGHLGREEIDVIEPVLGRLRGEEGEDAIAAEAEFQDIVNIRNLEDDTAKQQSYFHMFFGIGSGKLHTGRRVQLVIWLQILQEWIGIAGITIYGPEIFTIAGISSKDRLWVSGVNNITYMVRERASLLLLRSSLGRRHEGFD